MFKSINTIANNTIIGGDLNLCLFKGDTDVNVASFINLMSSYFLCPLINIATREQNNNNSLIDHIWSNIPNSSYSGVIDCSITDHYPIFSIFKYINNKIDDLISIKFRDFSVGNISNFKAELSSYQWFTHTSDVNAMTQFFLDKFNSLYNKCFPIKCKNIGINALKNLR